MDIGQHVVEGAVEDGSSTDLCFTLDEETKGRGGGDELELNEGRRDSKERPNQDLYT